MNTPTALLVLWSLVSGAFALQPEPGAVFVRVVDVGPGLCCVIKIPGGHNIIYDAGNFQDNGRTAFAAIREFVPVNEEIDLLILSHSDSDHLAATKAICDRYQVRRIFHPGVERDTGTWREAKAAINAEAATGRCSVTNLAQQSLRPGTSFRMGEARAILVCGFHLPPADWDIEDEPERMNAGSIILRLTYKGRSILFCGDAVGRHRDSPNDVCIAGEKFMVENRQRVPISADVIVAPHHGANNGSSAAFIAAVRPKCAIFSAGHRFSHPTLATANRYLAFGLSARDMFRTDRGDDEGAAEWDSMRVPGTTDRAGDDDVDVLIRSNGRIAVDYAKPLP